MYVKEWMSQAVVTVSPADSVFDAQQKLIECRIRHLPVVDGEALVGVISQTDLQGAMIQLAAMQPQDVPLQTAMRHALVGDHMNAPAITIAHDATVEEAASQMRQSRIGCLPVVRAGALVGLVTKTDMFDVLVEALGMDHPGARMVFDMLPGKETTAFERVVDWLRSDHLVPSCVVAYRPRGGHARLLVRAAEASEA